MHDQNDAAFGDDSFEDDQEVSGVSTEDAVQSVAPVSPTAQAPRALAPVAQLVAQVVTPPAQVAQVAPSAPSVAPGHTRVVAAATGLAPAAAAVLRPRHDVAPAGPDRVEWLKQELCSSAHPCRNIPTILEKAHLINLWRADEARKIKFSVKTNKLAVVPLDATSDAVCATLFPILDDTWGELVQAGLDRSAVGDFSSIVCTGVRPGSSQKLREPTDQEKKAVASWLFEALYEASVRGDLAEIDALAPLEYKKRDSGVRSGGRRPVGLHAFQEGSDLLAALASI